MTAADNLLYQVQATFTYLKESEKRAADTTGISLAYRDWSGQPMNPVEQQDADEFLSVLMERLEERLKPTPQKSLLKVRPPPTYANAPSPPLISST